MLQKPSFLSVDHLLKKDYMIKFLKSNKYFPGSDSTLMRNLSNNIQEDELFDINKKIVLTNFDLLKNKKVNKTVGILDGSGFGHFLKEVMVVAGEINQIVGFSDIFKKGKELVAAENLIKKISADFRELSFDIILGDALYYTKNIFANCKKYFRSNVLVKFRHESVNVIKDAVLYFNDPKYAPEVIISEGYDDLRMLKYKIETVKNLSSETIPDLLSVSRITEIDSKSNITEVFYAITNDLSLCNDEIRYLSHLRWQIENNGFKELNKLLSSKRKYTKDESVMKNLLWIMFMFYNFFEYYLYSIPEKEIFGIGKTIILDFLQLIFETLICYVEDESG